MSTYFLRKKPVVLALTSLIPICLFLRFWLFSSPSTSLQTVNNLHGLLYMVTMTDTKLPHGFDVNDSISPSTWVPREDFDAKVWDKRIKRLNADTPVIVFSKSFCPYSRRAKDLLSRYALNPAPSIIEVDLRDDSEAIKGLLKRFTGRATFPNIILQGRSLGGYDELQELHDHRALEKAFKKAEIHMAGNIPYWE